MGHFVEGEDRRQPALLPSCLEDYVSEENPARVIDAFVDELDLGRLSPEERAEVGSAAKAGRAAVPPVTSLDVGARAQPVARTETAVRAEREVRAQPAVSAEPPVQEPVARMERAAPAEPAALAERAERAERAETPTPP